MKRSIAPRMVSFGLLAGLLALAVIWRLAAEEALRLSATFTWLLACVIAGALLCADATRAWLAAEGIVGDPGAGMRTAPAPADPQAPLRFAAGAAWFAAGLAGLAAFYYGYLARVHG